jgi:AraC-like DNA-binding protein
MRTIATELLFRNDARTPLGRLTTAGFISNSAGVRGPGLRVLGSFAIVYLLDGSGSYSDAAGRAVRVRAGDLLLIFPDIGHTYGPGAGETWSEFYCVFDGPVFALLRQVGLLNPARPICHLAPVEEWLGRLTGALASPPALTSRARMCELNGFLHVLSDILSLEADDGGEVLAAEWIARACELLGADLGREIDAQGVAAEVGLPYETFRKRFQRVMGVSPGRYRAIRRIDAACALLQRPELTLYEIAAALGFSDEFYFSRRFKQVVGISPRAFRRSLPATREAAERAGAPHEP